ncbi:MAG: glutamate--tRNA ligase [Bacillota bacterium]|nr:glutamate--tRNA ligase [Bacillota bacterium]NLL26316.1 glutamate--tRNA ligase [Erysipelotrichia bacterium]
MDYQKLADMLFPKLKHDCQYYFDKYPKRDLPKGAEVLRIAPSPTGFIHLGNLYGALADERIAHQSGGVFYLRIEDTDSKRKVPGAVEAIISSFDYFQIYFDEGAHHQPHEGNYGPYYQKQRKEIYQTFAKRLVSEGKAYPCFCSGKQLTEIRKQQKEINEATGYYGKWASCRNLTLEEVKARLEKKEKFVIRMRSTGNVENQSIFHDEIKGDITVRENNQDVVIIKTDGIPTYHFAHAIDDTLMQTTIVLRGEEWLGTLPVHLELFEMLGFKLPRYAHTTVLMKIDETGTKRKLSKRKDPELALDYYRQLGYHPYAVKLYLMTLLNWNFEQWHLKNPDSHLEEFKFSLDKMGQSGALFDLDKLHNISKTYLSRLSLEEMKEFLKMYVSSQREEQYDMYFKDEDYLEKILTLGMGLKLRKRRKDYIYASQILKSIDLFYHHNKDDEFNCDNETARTLLTQFVETYDYNDDNSAWFDKVKTVSANNGYAAEMKDYKTNPEKYKGSVADVSEVIRIAVTGRKNTPDLWTIMQILGKEEVLNRISNTLKELD